VTRRSDGARSSTITTINSGSTSTMKGAAVAGHDDPAPRRRQRFHDSAFVAVSVTAMQALTATPLCPTPSASTRRRSSLSRCPRRGRRRRFRFSPTPPAPPRVRLRRRGDDHDESDETEALVVSAADLDTTMAMADAASVTTSRGRRRGGEVGVLHAASFVAGSVPAKEALTAMQRCATPPALPRVGGGAGAPSITRTTCARW